jgi:hypothetical protein
MTTRTTFPVCLWYKNLRTRSARNEWHKHCPDPEGLLARIESRRGQQHSTFFSCAYRKLRLAFKGLLHLSSNNVTCPCPSKTPTRLNSIFEDGPQRTLATLQSDVHTVQTYMPPPGWSVVDFAVHPSGDISAILTTVLRRNLVQHQAT